MAPSLTSTAQWRYAHASSSTIKLSMCACAAPSVSPPRDEKPKQPATAPHWRAVAERVHHVLRRAQEAGAISNLVGLMKVDDCVFEQNEAGTVRLRCPLCVLCHCRCCERPPDCDSVNWRLSPDLVHRACVFAVHRRQAPSVIVMANWRWGPASSGTTELPCACAAPHACSVTAVSYHPSRASAGKAH